jgi:hypothetical protein
MLKRRGVIAPKFLATRSPYPTEVAWTRTRSSSSLGTGTGKSCSSNTSGAPYLVKTLALIRPTFQRRPDASRCCLVALNSVPRYGPVRPLAFCSTNFYLLASFWGHSSAPPILLTTLGASSLFSPRLWLIRSGPVPHHEPRSGSLPAVFTKTVAHPVWPGPAPRTPVGITPVGITRTTNPGRDHSHHEPRSDQPRSDQPAVGSARTPVGIGPALSFSALRDYPPSTEAVRVDGPQQEC